MEPTDYELITTAEALARAVTELSRHQVLGFDTETTSLDPFSGRLRLIQFSSPTGAYIIDMDCFSGAGDPATSEVLAPLRELISSLRPVKVAHNAKFDAKWVKKTLGVELGGVFDTLLASQLISAGDLEDRHALANVATRYLGETIDKAERLSDWSAQLSTSQLEYAARDASVLLPLREKMVDRLKADDLVRCAQLEFECVQPVAEMELAGFFLDQHRWREQLVAIEHQRIKLADDLQEMLAAGAAQGSLFGRAEINLDSQVQVSE